MKKNRLSKARRAHLKVNPPRERPVRAPPAPIPARIWRKDRTPEEWRDRAAAARKRAGSGA